MITDRTEFEDTMRGNFKIPATAFDTRSETGYYDGHLNAYYKVWRLAEQNRVEKLRMKLITIADAVVLRRSPTTNSLIARQICVDINEYLNGIS